jgi:hypothetical protein
MQKIIREFVRRSMHTRIAGYSEDELDGKRMWHLQGRRVLMHIAAKMGLTEDEYEISNNYAGPAVSGEITLHTDFVYIQWTQGLHRWAESLDAVAISLSTELLCERVPKCEDSEKCVKKRTL